LTEFLYSGEQFDSKIGQQYLRQRYYDSATGRFNRLDPFFGNLNDPLSLHKYLYTHADPVNGIDPNGLESLVGMLSVSGISGNMRGNNQKGVQAAGRSIRTYVKEEIKELFEVFSFDEDKDPISKKMAIVGEALWVKRLLTEHNYIGVGMTNTPIGSHGPDIAAVSIDKTGKIKVLIGEVKATSQSRVMSLLSDTKDGITQMSFNWLARQFSLEAIGSMVFAVLQKVGAQLVNNITGIPATAVMESLSKGELDLYLLRAKYNKITSVWALQGYRLLTLNTSSGSAIDPNSVARDVKDMQDPLQKVTTYTKKVF
jgi:RHS repeat-associated protein